MQICRMCDRAGSPGDILDQRAYVCTLRAANAEDESGAAKLDQTDIVNPDVARVSIDNLTLAS